MPMDASRTALPLMLLLGQWYPKCPVWLIAQMDQLLVGMLLLLSQQCVRDHAAICTGLWVYTTLLRCPGG